MSLVVSTKPTNWVAISAAIGTRSSKQCYERYQQHLKPGLNHAPITLEEGQLIEHLVKNIGKRWARIARYLCGRSANGVKNWWNLNIYRRQRERHNLQGQVIDYKPLLMQYPYVASSVGSREGSQLLHHFEYQPTLQQPSLHGIDRLSGNTTFGQNHQPTYIDPPMAQHQVKPDFPSAHWDFGNRAWTATSGTFFPEMGTCNLYSTNQKAPEIPHQGAFSIHTPANGNEFGSSDLCLWVDRGIPGDQTTNKSVEGVAGNEIGPSGLCLRVDSGILGDQATYNSVEGIAQDPSQDSLQHHSEYSAVSSTKGRMATETRASGLDIRQGEESSEVSGRVRRRMSLSEVIS